MTSVSHGAMSLTSVPPGVEIASTPTMFVTSSDGAVNEPA